MKTCPWDPGTPRTYATSALPPTPLRPHSRAGSAVAQTNWVTGLDGAGGFVIIKIHQSAN